MASRSPGSRPGDHPTLRARTRRWTWLLLVPFVGLLAPTVYNKHDPALAGVPFFYWYQLTWIPLTVLCMVVVYRATKGDG